MSAHTHERTHTTEQVLSILIEEGRRGESKRRPRHVPNSANEEKNTKRALTNDYRYCVTVSSSRVAVRADTNSRHKQHTRAMAPVRDVHIVVVASTVCLFLSPAPSAVRDGLFT